MDKDDPNFDENDENNYQEIPIEGDDPRRYFIFLPAEKAQKVVNSMNERDGRAVGGEDKKLLR